MNAYIDLFEPSEIPTDFVVWTWREWAIVENTDGEFDLYDPYGILVETSSDPEALARKAAQIDKAW